MEHQHQRFHFILLHLPLQHISTSTTFRAREHGLDSRLHEARKRKTIGRPRRAPPELRDHSVFQLRHSERYTLPADFVEASGRANRAVDLA